ncbi:glycine-rich domain-containing protein [Sabulibacter ruber]|uniref:glycine-rich domain-containing protein n=1 Tax=Sabulibacter ruber TaxID=2811901 RepID=UPI001A957742|nr:hypothetical protein [Sabulibacter ruber]
MDLELWERLEKFDLDDPTATFNFSDRLARENGWTRAFAYKVVDEYKKFLYLCCISDKPVTPSDPVDQAWHLHLTYTHSYWIDLCQNTLGKLLHHTPTKGGETEAAHYQQGYAYTYDLYTRVFGHVPRAGVWEEKSERFQKTKFVRVDTHKFLLLNKPPKALIWFYVLLVGILNIILFRTNYQLAGLLLLINVGVPLLYFFIRDSSEVGFTAGGLTLSAGAGAGCSGGDDSSDGCGGDGGCGGCGGCGGD